MALGCFFIISLVANGLTLDDVSDMIRRGDLAEASRTLDSIAAQAPRNARADYLRGELMIACNDDAKAEESFAAAQKKGDHTAILRLAEIANRQFRVDDAEQLLDDYRAYLKRNRRKKLTDESGDLEARISKTRTMLDRVENIVVFDSIVVDREDFFRAYRLSPESGSLLAADDMPAGFNAADQSTAYRSEDGRELIWAEENEDNNLVLKRSDSLIGNEWSDPESLGDHLSLGGDASFPFLMPDGVTLYYASDGEGSIGGYDIFISRNNGLKFLDPQNIGLPYNSPYDDYLMVIDELTGIGWWATDRNRIPGFVTIYMFTPSDLRHNIDSDSPELASRARLSSIADTWPENADFEPLRAKLAGLHAKASRPKPQFAFSMPDGRVLTRLDQFASPRARETMERYLAAKSRLDESRQRLSSLRQRYAGGDKSVSSEIFELERQEISQRQNLKRLSNDVIKAETSR